ARRRSIFRRGRLGSHIPGRATLGRAVPHVAQRGRHVRSRRIRRVQRRPRGDQGGPRGCPGRPGWLGSGRARPVGDRRPEHAHRRAGDPAAIGDPDHARGARQRPLPLAPARRAWRRAARDRVASRPGSVPRRDTKWIARRRAGLDLPTGSRDYNPNATRFETGTVDAAAFVGLRQTLVVHRLLGSWVTDRVRALRRRLLERIAELPFAVRSTPEAPTGIVVVEPRQGDVAALVQRMWDEERIVVKLIDEPGIPQAIRLSFWALHKEKDID